MKVKVFVTKEDIARGTRYCVKKCPVARAIRRATGIRSVRVVPTMYIRVGVRCIANRVAGVLEWAERFDAGKRVKPFTFTLDIPEGG